MFGLTWFRKLALSDTAIDLDRPIELEEFLRSVRSGAHDQPTPQRRAEVASSRPAQPPAQGSRPPRRRPPRPHVRPIAAADPPRLDLDALLDQALLETFPASDPIAVTPR